MNMMTMIKKTMTILNLIGDLLFQECAWSLYTSTTTKPLSCSSLLSLTGSLVSQSKYLYLYLNLYLWQDKCTLSSCINMNSVPIHPYIWIFHHIFLLDYRCVHKCMNNSVCIYALNTLIIWRMNRNLWRIALVHRKHFCKLPVSSFWGK